MQNPFAPEPASNSYTNLKERMFRQIQAARVNDHIFEIVQRAYEEALAKEYIVLSRPERQRMLAQVMRLVLDDMLKKLDDRTNPA
jgi:hypothetical protein